jgi:quinol monooxygenase YgiN
MSKVAVHAKFTAQPGRGDELVAAVEEMFDTVLNEPDTLVYALHREDAEPDVVWMYELYADQRALDVHGRSDAARRFGARLEELLAREPEVGFTTPLRAKGMRVEP